jgi:hypothetical protein
LFYLECQLPPKGVTGRPPLLEERIGARPT